MGHPIVIIGAGVAGLVAARHLEKAGFKPLIIEASARAGGRVKTDEKNGFLLDHGFQVLLTEYREAREYLDYDALDLRHFNPGAVIYAGGRSFRIADPLRAPARLPGMVFSPVGTLKDKFLMWQLSRELKGMENDALFAVDGKTTEAFLRGYGFSEKIISQFFRPFFGGIFLENQLKTGAAMFRFVFRTFSLGNAAVPAGGMEEIPRQLATALKQTTFQFGRKVQTIGEQEVHLEGGQVIPFQQLIIATDPNGLLSRLGDQGMEYNRTQNLYFRASRSPLGEPTIGLVADENNTINNFCTMTDVAPGYAPQDEVLLSITLKDWAAQDPPPVETVAADLHSATGQADLELTFLAAYDIPKALPTLDTLRYDLPATQFRITEDIVLAGDYMLNASLDAAMRSGRRAAEAVIQVGVA